MKKLHYLFAALLGGATLSLTSCIDTTEPAGIEAMRTSKSEYLKAKAGYENALAQLKLVEVEKEKVAVEAAKIALELDKIDVEMAKLALNKQAVLDSLELIHAKAQNEADLAEIAYEVARLNQQMAELEDEMAMNELEKEEYLLQREQRMLDLYTYIAQAEQSYREAITDLKLAMLTYKDEAMQDKLDGYQLKLEAYNSTLNGKRSDLVRAQLDKWTYENNKAMFVESLPVEKAEMEKDIELQKSLIAKLDSLNKLNIAGDITALYAQIDAYDEELVALEEKEEEMLKELKAMQTIDPKVAEDIAKLNVEIAKLVEEEDAIEEKKQEEYTLTIAKDDVDATMVQVLGEALRGSSGFDAAFKVVGYDPMTYMDVYEMVADFVLVDELQNMAYSEAAGWYGQYVGIIQNIESGYQNEYAAAYREVVTEDWNAYASQMFDEDGKVKDIYLARLEAALERGDKDESALSKAEKEYNETVEEWGKAYDAYLAATAKFKGYANDAPEFDAVWEAVEAYLEAKNDTLNYTEDGAVKAGAPAYALYLKIANFIKDKNAVDGLYKGDFVEYYDSVYVAGAKVEEQDEVKLAEFNALVLSWADNKDGFEYYVGGKLPTYDYGYNFNTVIDAAENGGTLAQFLVASEKLFGDTWFSVNGDIILPIKNGDEYVVSENIPTWVGGVYAAYHNAVEYEENAAKYEAIFANVEKWIAFVDKLEAQNEECVKALEAINDELKANSDQQQELAEQIAELKELSLDMEAIWAKEFEIYKIFGTEWNHAYSNGEFDRNNPYIYGNPTIDVITEASVINDAKNLVQVAIDEADDSYHYWYYDPVSESMEYRPSAELTSLIESAEYELEEMEKDLEKLNLVIEAVAKYDAIAGSWEDFFDNSGLELGKNYDDAIAECEAEIAALEEDIKAVQASIAALIAAYEAGELDVELPGAEA